LVVDRCSGAEPVWGVLRADVRAIMPDLAMLDRALGRRQPPSSTVLNLAREALAEAGALVQPRAVWGEFEAAGVAASLLPGVPEEELAGVSALIGVVCTIGGQLEARVSHHFAQRSPLGSRR